MQTIVTVVVNEHTLGVVAGPHTLQILRASVLRGSPYPGMGVVYFNPDNSRLATQQDFADYGVVFDPMYLGHPDAMEVYAMTILKRFDSLKKQNPDALLLFRVGDFYELFHDDARTASRMLGLTLTTRGKNLPEPDQVPMCGFPYHQLDNYQRRILQAGHKVAVAEQVEPKSKRHGSPYRLVTESEP